MSGGGSGAARPFCYSDMTSEEAILLSVLLLVAEGDASQIASALSLSSKYNAHQHGKK